MRCFLKRRGRRLLLILLLVPVLLIAGLWLSRDRIAILMSKREMQRREPPPRVVLPPQDEATLQRLRTYLSDHHETPEQYILGLFDRYDIVFLGEYHRLKHDVQLVQRLIPLLHERGVTSLGIEFADRPDQPLIDALLSAEEYDSDLASRVLFNSSVFWGYQEYADLFRAAWESNREAPQGTPRFRIIALNARRDWGLIRTPEDRHDPEILNKVWNGVAGDQYMAESILREVADGNGKALVYCGIHHAFTTYKQPCAFSPEGTVTDYFDQRLGHLVRERLGDRAVTVALHASWPSQRGSGESVHPAGGALDALMKQLPESHRRAGFDTRDTPFGQLPCPDTLYGQGRDDFRLADFCDGYIIQGPFASYEGVTLIKGFINRRNVAEAKERAANPMFRTGKWRWLGPAFMNHLIDADARRLEPHFAALE
jgi:Haem-binding uptake, Tiki superfamily, ChaN